MYDRELLWQLNSMKSSWAEAQEDFIEILFMFGRLTYLQ